MKKSIIVAFLFGLFSLLSTNSFAQKQRKCKPYKVKTEQVRGYVKKNGTYVAPYRRSRRP